MNNIGPGARVFLGAQAPGTEGLRDMNMLKHGSVLLD